VLSTLCCHIVWCCLQVTRELLEVQEVLHGLCYSNHHSPKVPGLLTQLLGLLQQTRSKQLVLRWGLLLIVAQDTSSHTELDRLMVQQAWMRDCITLPMCLLHLAAVGSAAAELAKDVMLLLPPLSHDGTAKLQQVGVEARHDLAVKLRNSPLGLVDVPFVRRALLLEAPHGLSVAGQLPAAEAAGSSKAAGSSARRRRRVRPLLDVRQLRVQGRMQLAAAHEEEQQLLRMVRRLQQQQQDLQQQDEQLAAEEAAAVAAAAGGTVTWTAWQPLMMMLAMMATTRSSRMHSSSRSVCLQRCLRQRSSWSRG
jgi:hypothetical protein